MNYVFNVMNRLLVITIVCGSGLFITAPSFGKDRGAPKQSKVDLSAYSVVEGRVMLKGVTKYDKVKYIQQEYLRKIYEDYEVGLTVQGVPEIEGAPCLQSYFLKNSEGEEVVVCFDISDAYRARNLKGNEELKKLVNKVEKIREENSKKRVEDEVSEAEFDAMAQRCIQRRDEEVRKFGKTQFDELTDEEQRIVDKQLESFIQEVVNESRKERKNKKK